MEKKTKYCENEDLKLKLENYFSHALKTFSLLISHICLAGFVARLVKSLKIFIPSLDENKLHSHFEGIVYLKLCKGNEECFDRHFVYCLATMINPNIYLT